MRRKQKHFLNTADNRQIDKKGSNSGHSHYCGSFMDVSCFRTCKRTETKNICAFELLLFFYLSCILTGADVLMSS